MTWTAQSNQPLALPLPRSMAQALAYISTLALPAAEISLILDEGSSMMIWQQLTEQLVGGFRAAAEPGKVGIFRFDSTEPSESLRLRAAVEIAGDDTGDYPGSDPSVVSGAYEDVSDQILLGVSRRHIIFVVSDCAGDAWYDGRVSRALCRWARRAFVSIMQPLPERFWLRSALREQPWVAFAAAPGISCNGELRCSEAESELLGDGALIPVVAIEARSLATWSGWFGGGDASRDAIFDAQSDDVVGIYARVHPEGTSETRTPLSAAQRVADFRRSCSTEANQLAGLLSAAPLRLPIIAAIMRRLAPAAT